MLSQSAIYAIRAMSYLAGLEPGRRTLSREIAETLDLPVHFLAKVLGNLSAEGLLESTRGKTGGFRLKRKPSEITLLDIVDPIDRLSSQDDCLMGNTTCGEDGGCSLHEGWSGVRENLIDFLKKTTLDTIEQKNGSVQGGSPDAEEKG